MRSATISTRRMRRAYERYGKVVFNGQVSKHAGGRQRSPKAKPARKTEDLIYQGLLKIRALWLRAGLLIIPYGEYELKAILQQAKEEFDTKGMVSINTSLLLHAAGHDVEKLEKLWRLMTTAKVDMNGIDDHPDLINTPEEETNEKGQ